MYKLYPSYIIMCDIGISFTSAYKLVYPTFRRTESEGEIVADKTCFRFPWRLSGRVLGAQIELAEIVEGVSGKDVCTLQVRFDPDSIETPVVNRSPLTYTFMAGREILGELQAQVWTPFTYFTSDHIQRK